MQDKSIATAYASDEGTEGKIIPLRPHHGMCLAYFKGEGYSGGFTAHMAEMLKLFLSGKRIRLHVDTDEICSACPNNQDGIESRAGAGFCCIYKNSPGKDSCDG